jgi:hypothetical protein
MQTGLKMPYRDGPWLVGWPAPFPFVGAIAAGKEQASATFVDGHVPFTVQLLESCSI